MIDIREMRTVLLTLLSVTLTGLVLGHAYVQKRQFYPAVVYITKSNPSMAVLYIQAFVCVILMGKLFRKVFFGNLRAAEVEHLIERSWYAVTETCLAFTVFRDDFNPRFVAMFTLLLFLKSFHWLGEDRVDYMERSPIISLKFHMRMLGLILVLSLADIYFINAAYHSTLIKGASVQLVFGFEYAILFIAVATTFVKYILHSIDLYSENPWDNKAVYLLYTELLMGFFKVMLYILFTLIMIKVHTFPLFAIRPLYLAMRNFKKALHDVIMSRRAIHNMNTLYPNATSDDLRDMDNVCIICREEMVDGAKKLPCQHIFHANCLRSWFQRQQTCPTCRMDVLRQPAATQPQVARQQQEERPPAAGAANVEQRQGVSQSSAQPQTGGVEAATTLLAGSQTNQLPMPQQPFTIPNASLFNMPFFLPPPSTSATASLPPGLPIPFVPPPFTVPFPSSSVNLDGMTDDELKEMEGSERRNVEARIECLRNIQTLLDAAMVQMQQYTSVCANLRHDVPTSSKTQSTPSTSGVASTSKSVGGESSVVGGESSIVGGESSVVGGESSVVGGESSVVGGESSVVGGESVVVGDVKSGTEDEDLCADELRRRRLNKLTSGQVS